MMRALRKVLAAAALAACAFFVSAEPTVEVSFEPLTAADQWDARTYRAIWKESGPQIVAAFEAVTCLPFAEPAVSAVIANDVSHSGGPDHAMQLRATYSLAQKRATLVHELGHRHLWQLAKRIDGIDGHMTLFLVLDRVWARVWGEQFAAERIRGESEWLAEYDYGKAWRWAQSLTHTERDRLWNELLALNGFAARCDGSAQTVAASP
jgi:hypothetical protein